ncbi:MAG: demethoxyubiquinone hydroxylase family protein, partial [Rhodanobacteraceae bacterium]
MPADIRHPSPLDRMLAGVGHALQTTCGQPEAARPSPGDQEGHAELTAAERRHAAGLMRVNHTGEVCAQALYLGQAALA